MSKAKEIIEQTNAVSKKCANQKLSQAASDFIAWYCEQGRTEEADMALKHYQNSAETKSSEIAVRSLTQLGLLSAAHSKFEEAEIFLLEALAKLATDQKISNQSSVMISLAHLYIQQNRCIDAEAMLKQALKHRVKTYGAKHAAIAAGLESYAQLLKQANKNMLAGKMEMRAKEIRADLLAAISV